jgi:hypothetical protein
LIQLEGRMALESCLAPKHPNFSLDVIDRALRCVRGLVSPFKQLPPHVLSKIFEQFVRNRKTLDSRPAALLLCSVSKRWRSVAISTPSLWTSIQLIVRTGWDPIFERICLSRSSHHLVDIYLHCRQFVPGGLDEAIRLISRNISRVRYLSLILEPQGTGSFGSLPAYVLPSLKAGSITTASELAMVNISLPQGTIGWEWISAVAWNAPKLRGMSFTGDLLPNTPWSQLVHLGLGRVTLTDGLNVLSHAPWVRNCDLVITSSQPPAPRAVLVHSLRCLLLECPEGSTARDLNISEFFAHVQLPSLISLAIVGERNIRPHAFMSLLARSSCYLRRLILVETPMSGYDMRCVLRHPGLGRLTSLKIYHCWGAVTDPLIWELTRKQPPLLLSLKTIYLGPLRTRDGLASVLVTAAEKGVYSHHVLPGAPSLGEMFTYDILDSEYD